MPASSSDDRSTTVTICCSALTFSPGTTWRLPTMPEIGTDSVASRMPTRIEASCACADLSWARAASRRACDVCSAVGEMKFCAARPTLAVFWRSASTSAACADSTSAARSAARLCISARSITPITWPALTRLPSATLSESSVPAALARTTAVRGATSGPENSSVSGSRAATGRATSAATNSSGTGSFLSLSPPRKTLGSTAAATAAMAIAPRQHRSRSGVSPCGRGPDVQSKFAWPRV